MWVYIKSEPGLFTVGFYDPKGEWIAETDWEVMAEAAARVHYLNGGHVVEDDDRETIQEGDYRYYAPKGK